MSLDSARWNWNIEVETEAERLIKLGVPPLDAVLGLQAEHVRLKAEVAALTAENERKQLWINRITDNTREREAMRVQLSAQSLRLQQFEKLVEQALWHVQEAAKHSQMDLNVASAETLLEKALITPAPTASPEGRL